MQEIDALVSEAVAALKSAYKLKQTPVFVKDGFFSNDTVMLLAVLVAVFRCEFLFTFAKSGFTDISEDLLITDLQEIVNQADYEANHQLREFVKKLVIAGLLHKQPDKTKRAILKGILMDTTGQLSLANFDPGDHSNCALNALKRYYWPGETPEDELSEQSLEANDFLTVFRDYFAMTEQFQKHSSLLWEIDPCIEGLVCRLAEDLAKKWFFNGSSKVIPEHLMAIMSQLWSKDNMAVKYLKTIKFMRFYLKNDYSINLATITENKAVKSMLTSITFGVFEGSGRVWKEGAKFRRFNLEMVYEDNKTLGFRSIFDRIFFNLGLACNLVEEYTHAILYYDQYFAGLLFTIVDSKDRRPHDDSKNMSLVSLIEHNNGQSPNYMAITFDRNDLFDDVSCFVGLSTNGNCLADEGVVNTLIPVSNYDLDMLLVDFIEAKVMTPYAKTCSKQEMMNILTFSCNQDRLSKDQKTLLESLHTRLELNSSNCAITVGQLKKELLKIETKERHIPAKENLQLIKVDFIIGIQQRASSYFKFEVASYLEDVKIVPSISYHFKKCFDSDPEAKHEIELLSKADNHAPKKPTVISLDFYLPMYYIIDCSKIRGGLDLYEDLKLEYLKDFVSKEDSWKYRLCSFIAEDNKVKNQINIYDVREEYTEVIEKREEPASQVFLQKYRKHVNAGFKENPNYRLRYLEVTKFSDHQMTQEKELLMLNEFYEIFKLRYLIYKKKENEGFMEPF